MIANAPSLKQAVDEARNQHVAAVNAGDADAATGLFTPDAVFLPPGQPALAGTAAIRQWFTHVFTAFRVMEFGLEKDGSPALPVGGTYLTVYARLADGSARMIRDTFNGLAA